MLYWQWLRCKKLPCVGEVLISQFFISQFCPLNWVKSKVLDKWSSVCCRTSYLLPSLCWDQIVAPYGRGTCLQTTCVGSLYSLCSPQTHNFQLQNQCVMMVCSVNISFQNPVVIVVFIFNIWFSVVFCLWCLTFWCSDQSTDLLYFGFVELSICTVLPTRN